MLTRLSTLPVAALPAPEVPSFIKAAGITGLLVFVVGVLIIVVGTKIVAKADRQQVNQSARTGANVAIGVTLVVIGLLGAALPMIASALGFFTTTG